MSLLEQQMEMLPCAPEVEALGATNGDAAEAQIGKTTDNVLIFIYYFSLKHVYKMSYTCLLRKHVQRNAT
jgi:ADP-glucose pyrophosphorylase